MGMRLGLVIVLAGALWFGSGCARRPAVEKPPAVETTSVADSSPTTAPAVQAMQTVTLHVAEMSARLKLT
jgi:hypothetical protein